MLVQNGFPIEAILGKDIIEKGMTEDQMILFAHAIDAMSIRQINDQTLAVGSVMGNKESSKTIQKALMEKENTLFKFLIDYEVE